MPPVVPSCVFAATAASGSSWATSALFPSWEGGRVSSVSDGAGRSVSYSYDDAGFLTNVTDAAGGRWRMAYDPVSGALASELDPDGNETVRNLYNDFAQVTNQTTASGGTWYATQTGCRRRGE